MSVRTGCFLSVAVFFLIVLETMWSGPGVAHAAVIKVSPANVREKSGLVSVSRGSGRREHRADGEKIFLFPPKSLREEGLRCEAVFPRPFFGSIGARVGSEPARKPSSVKRGHPSETPVAGRLERLPENEGGPPLGDIAPSPRFPICLSSGGVCLASSIALGAVVSYTTFSPLPKLPLRRYPFCCTFRCLATPGR